MSAVFEQRMSRQEQRFMGLLEKVIDGNEAVKSQMQQQIDAL